jgi:hypothetical protein
MGQSEVDKERKVMPRAGSYRPSVRQVSVTWERLHYPITLAGAEPHR